jgi:hypothetical protein
MAKTFTDGLTWWMLLPAVLALLLLASEAGYHGALRQHARGSVGARKGQADMVVGALLGLLGLLLAFSFGIAEGRYHERKALVLADANAIGTTYLRADVLPQQQRNAVRALLREYVRARVEPDPRTLERAMRRAVELQRELWGQAMTAARAAPDSEAVSLFVQSLNDMIDLHESRVTVALHQRLPLAIFYSVAAVAMLALAVVGGSSGLSGCRSWVPTTALALAVSTVLVLVIELDKPLGSQLFEVNQASMRDLDQSLQPPSSAL